jgi:hypothetical protein
MDVLFAICAIVIAVDLTVLAAFLLFAPIIPLRRWR